MIEPTLLTYEQTLPLATGLRQREVAARDKQPPPPSPGCPVCGTAPAALDVTRSTTQDVIFIRLIHCGHVLAATGDDLRRAFLQARTEHP